MNFLSWFGNINLSKKLMLMLIVPIFGMFWFAQEQIRESMNVQSESEAILQLVKLTSMGSEMVHELQKERGMSAAYLSSNGAKMSTELPGQRKNTDDKKARLSAFLETFPVEEFGPEFVAKLDAGLSRLKELETTRERITALDIAAGEALGYYTKTNAAFLSVTGFLPQLSDNSAVSNTGVAYYNFLLGKERAGIERAVLASTFAIDRYGSGILKKVVRLQTEQNTYFDSFLSMATADQRQFYEQKLKDPSVADVESMRQTAHYVAEKNALASQLNSALGIGGLIDHFQKYAAKNDAKLLELFQQDKQKAEAAIARYELLPGLTSTDEGHVSTIRSLLQDYDAAIGKQGQSEATANVSDDQAKQALESLTDGGFGIDSAAWFQASTARINLLKAVEDRLASDLTVLASELNNQASAKSTMLILITIGALSITLALSWLVSRLVSGPIRNAVVISEHIAEGDLEDQIEVAGSDESSQLLSAMKKMQQQLKVVIRQDVQSAIDAARQGDLSVRVPLDGKDGCYRELGNSINQLVEINDRVITDVSTAVGAIADGDLNKEIEAEYEGSFDSLKNDIATLRTKLAVIIEKDIQSIVEAAVAGDLSQRIDVSNKSGFYRALSTSINDLVDISDNVIEETVEVVGAMAGGDLTKYIDSDYKGSFEQLKNGVNKTIDQITNIVNEIQNSSELVKTGAEEIASGNMDLSQRTEEQSSSLEETSSALEEITSTTRNNAENAQAADRLTKETWDSAKAGGQVVDDAVTAMDAISQSSQQISDIIGVIDEITFQTNLLSLNASVEAASAGEQGKGFAVVADEVRKLAGRSASAAKEIKELINDSTQKVEQGVDLVNKSGSTLGEIVTSVKKVTDIVAEIAAASNEQAAGIDEVNRAVSQMDEMTQQNAALVEEAAAASKSLGEQSHTLDEQITFFKVGRPQEVTCKPDSYEDYEDFEEGSDPVRSATGTG